MVTIEGVRLTARDLTFAYRRGAPVVLDRLNLECEPGSVTVLTGPSGAGKSTLLYLLALLLPASQGSVEWDGRSVESLPDGERSRLRAAHSGFVFQDAMLDPSRTVVDNVLESALFAGIDPQTARQRADELLAEFGISHRGDHRPGEISGGQAQRVALCRALVTNPDVVFGDEPTGNLDADSARIVWDALIRHAACGATVVVATHDESLAQAADHTIVIDLPDDGNDSIHGDGVVVTNGVGVGNGAGERP
ncbi:MAG: ATP-binding cassette domain-containing protein [Cellulomonadaceae bacterium]|jgi:ABC-type lipoprotein export system ATPase subunit|nr:ATP-binding cassette domain-containing protein [Cellulomonadaceae bacterium]